MVCPLFVLAVTVLTLVDRSFLSAVDWSPVHRTRVEWPSVLELGPHGGVLVAAFVVCGFLVASTGAATAVVGPSRRVRGVGAAVLLAGIALALEAFRPDRTARSPASWHDVVHNAAYPVIVVCALVACSALGSVGASGSWPRSTRASQVALLFLLGMLGASFVYAVAQIARDVALAVMLVWLEVVALDFWSSLRASREQP